jgi:serine/threonine protein kinase
VVVALNALGSSLSSSDPEAAEAAAAYKRDCAKYALFTNPPSKSKSKNKSEAKHPLIARAQKRLDSLEGFRPLLQRMLAFSPARRPGFREILESPMFCSLRVDDAALPALHAHPMSTRFYAV